MTIQNFQTRCRWPGTLMTLLCAAALAPAATAATGDTEFAVPLEGSAATWGAQYDSPSLSADGRYVTFGSTLSLLVSPEAPYVPHIYVYDRIGDVLERVSVATDGTPGNKTSWGASMSADGGFVAFISEADNLDPVRGDANGAWDIFLRDLSGTTTRITPDPGAGESETGRYRGLQLNADGTYLVFTTNLDSLSTADSNGDWDVYVYDFAADQFLLVSQDATGAAAGALDGITSISDDGRLVSFVSTASGIVAGGANGREQVYVRDLVAGSTELVSVNLTGGPAAGGAWSSSISGDGSLVLFAAQDNDLTTTDDHGAGQAYLRDLAADTTEMVSIDAAGTAGDADADLDVGNLASAHAISDDGRFVIFNSRATNLDPVNNVYRGAYVHDRVLGTTRLVSIESGASLKDSPMMLAAQQVSLSGDGRYAAFVTQYFLNSTFEEMNCCTGWVYIHDLGPTDPVDMIGEVVDLIANLEVDGGLGTGLYAKLDSALGALADGNASNDVSSCNTLDALISSVEAQSPRRIDPAEAALLIDRTRAIQQEIGCG
jgi:Tol biopolymer transport system component